MNVFDNEYFDFFNFFEILCFDSRDSNFTLRAMKLHHRIVLKHVFEREIIKTKFLKRFISIWFQINVAYELMNKNFRDCVKRYQNCTQIKWNVFAKSKNAIVKISWNRIKRKLRIFACNERLLTNRMQFRINIMRKWKKISIRKLNVASKLLTMSKNVMNSHLSIFSLSISMMTMNRLSTISKLRTISFSKSLKNSSILISKNAKFSKSSLLRTIFFLIFRLLANHVASTILRLLTFSTIFFNHFLRKQFFIKTTIFSFHANVVKFSKTFTSKHKNTLNCL